MNLKAALTYEPAELKFGTSGLRGLVTDMTDLECYINTTGFLDFLMSTGLAQNSTVLVAGDLRDSTPQITAAVWQAILDKGLQPENHGSIPTPALAYYAREQGNPCIVITGSHIPADRNGIKFYKSEGEVLKADETPINTAVAAVRQKLYAQPATDSLFDATGTFKQPVVLPAGRPDAEEAYRQRYLDAFPGDSLSGKKVVYYQHSAVGRDLLPAMLTALGAEVVTVGRSEVFVPIDSENVTAEDQAYFKKLAGEHPDAFAILSTDGDSDRPFVIDETGQFHRGDALGAVVADWCQADAAAFPVSSSDAIDQALQSRKVPFVHTKIGSPYVIEAMQQAAAQGAERVVGWEVNGGFLLGTDIPTSQGVLRPLPTRDAFFPMLAALLQSIATNSSISALFAQLPQRFTDAGLIDNFPVEVSQAIVQRFAEDTPEARATLTTFFTTGHGFGTITSINTLDGIRITFNNGDIAHLRPSGNAPQLRIYSVANTQERAEAIVAMALQEPDGIFRKMQQAITAD